MSQLTICTSQKGWLTELAKAYKDHTPVRVVDDANIGIDPTTQTIFEMGRKANLSTAEITAVCVSCGMSVAGVGMVLLAFFDPEPTTKLGLMIGSGAILALTGGLSAIRILTKNKPPHIKAGTKGFEIFWD
jgi:hypothetical protein